MRAPLAALLALCCVRLAGAALQYDYLNVYSCPPATCLARKCVRRPRRRRRGIPRTWRKLHHGRTAHQLCSALRRHTEAGGAMRC
jgi:hypothetical protein